MRWLKKVLGQTGRKAAEERCTRGYIAAREGRLDEAQRLYDDAVDADPGLAVAGFNAGQTALERYNRDVAVLDAAGRDQRLRQALTHLEHALSVDDRHAPSWRALARVQERLGRVDAACAAWARVEACLGASDVGADVAIDGVVGAPRKEVTREQQQERAEARSERLRLKPGADLVIALAHVQELIGDEIVNADVAAAAVDALLAARDRAAEANVPSPAGLSTVAGSLLRKVGRLEEARGLFDAALVADPRDLEALRNLATVCLNLGDLPSALRASLCAYRLDPGDSGLVCNVGVCHLASWQAGKGDLVAAREYLDLARQMAAKDPIVVRALAALAEAEKTAATAP